MQPQEDAEGEWSETAVRITCARGQDPAWRYLALINQPVLLPSTSIPGQLIPAAGRPLIKSSFSVECVFPPKMLFLIWSSNMLNSGYLNS